jgi:hypothetical protein
LFAERSRPDLVARSGCPIWLPDLVARSGWQTCVEGEGRLIGTTSRDSGGCQPMETANRSEGLERTAIV